MAFDVDHQDLENNIPQSAWKMVAPNIGQDDTITYLQGFSTLQNEQKEKEDTIDTVSDYITRNKRDTLSMLCAKAAKWQGHEFSGLMHNRAWCKSYINAVRHGKSKKDTEFF